MCPLYLAVLFSSFTIPRFNSYRYLFWRKVSNLIWANLHIVNNKSAVAGSHRKMDATILGLHLHYGRYKFCGTACVYFLSRLFRRTVTNVQNSSFAVYCSTSSVDSWLFDISRTRRNNQWGLISQNYTPSSQEVI